MNRKTLWCFSPAVMLGTFTLEFLMAAWVLYRYRFDVVGRIVVALLILLGLFQVTEYVVCTSSATRLWGVIGYLAITWLPALAFHLVLRLVKGPFAVALGGYALALAWSVLFLVHGGVITRIECTGNYNILSLAGPWSILYGYYYYGLLLAGLSLCMFGRSKAPQPIRSTRGWMALAYLLLIVPTGMVNMLDPETVHGIPSIMCGFALLFAGILTFRIMPLLGRSREAKN